MGNCVNCGDNQSKPCGCPDTDCRQVKTSELGDLQTVYGKDENGCPLYELADHLVCRQLASAETGPAAVPGQTSIIDPNTCEKRVLPAFPAAAQVTTDNTIDITVGGTTQSPIYNLAVNVCNALAKITGGAIVLPYGSTKTLVGDDCQRYRLPSAPAFDSPDGTVQVTQGGTGIAPLYSLAVNACAVLAKITGNPIKLPFGGGVLVGKDCQLYQLPDLPVIHSTDQSVTVTQTGTNISPVFNLVVNLCKALVGVADIGNVAAWGEKVLTRNANGTCEIKALPTPSSETILTVQDSQTLDLTASGVAGHNVTGNVKVSGVAGNIISANADGLYASNPAGDNWGTQVVQHDTTITGDGTNANPLHVVPCAVIQGVTTSLTPVQAGDLIPVKKPDGTCEARPMPAAASVLNDCTLINSGGVFGINPTALLIGSTLDLNAATIRPWQKIAGSRNSGDPISDIASATISNASTCRTARVQVRVDYGYWGLQIATLQDLVIAAGFEVNTGSGWKRVSTMEGDEGKDIFSDSSNHSDMGQDGTSVSFVLNIPAGSSSTVQARVVKAGTDPSTSYYSEIPIISWFGMAI